MKKQLKIFGILFIILGLIVTSSSFLFTLTGSKGTTVNTIETTGDPTVRATLYERLYYTGYGELQNTELDYSGCSDVAIKYYVYYFDDVMIEYLSDDEVGTVALYNIQTSSKTPNKFPANGDYTYGQSYSWKVDKLSKIVNSVYSIPKNKEDKFGKNFNIKLVGANGYEGKALVCAKFQCLAPFSGQISQRSCRLFNLIAPEEPECTKDKCIGTKFQECNEQTGKIISKEEVLGKCGLECNKKSDCNNNELCENNKCEEECISNVRQSCDDDKIYNFNSCGERGSLVDSCEYGCYLGQCNSESNEEINEELSCGSDRAETKCDDNEVYFYNGCGEKTSLNKDCALNKQICRNGDCIDSELNTCNFLAGESTPPCDGADWLDYPDCIWDEDDCQTEGTVPITGQVIDIPNNVISNEECLKSLDPVVLQKCKCQDPKTDEEVIDCFSSTEETNEKGLNKTMEIVEIIKVISGVLTFLMGIGLFILGVM